MKKIQIKEKCQSCNGTGIYSGMGESSECGVVCSNCKGSGCFNFVHEYEDFTERTVNNRIKHIYEANPGIKVGEENGYKFEDFGGMTYKDWLCGKKFKMGMENRLSTCPAWWYQTVDCSKKPKWCSEYGFPLGLSWGRSFSSCKQFYDKEKCWSRFDKENK